MKKVIIFFTICFSLSSCMKGILDRAPLNIISDENVWTDTILMDAYLTQIYAQMGNTILLNETPGTTAGDWASSADWNGPFIVNELSDECKTDWIVGQSQAKVNGLRIGGGLLEWWEQAYQDIRALNEFIQRVPTTSASESFKRERVAEARFLRAYNYFQMVKRYGGVPLITAPQQTTDPKDSLYPKRTPEKEIYDFVLSETAAIADDLPEEKSADYGRPTKYAALALECRAALFAGSIATFGTIQLNGILGIDKSQADHYYQECYDAANAIMESGHYSLYKEDQDKVTNFKNIFLVKNNPEVIFTVPHSASDAEQGGNGWVWDFFQCPKPQAWDAGNQNAPYLEMAESFEHVDGTPGTLDLNAIQKGLWTTQQLWANMDPRFYATIWTQDVPWKGDKVDGHNGILLPDGTIQIDGSYNGILAKGPQQNHFSTGFGVMKYLDENHDNMGQRATSSTDWIVFRYAEILLNYAEAAYELGKSSDALTAINKIRDRAGIALLESIDREKIRHERKIELAFEGHRYWDLRRWRTAMDVLTVNRSGLRYILDYSTKKYRLQVIQSVDGTVQTPQFKPENYYFPITNTRTANNQNLVENPGYN